MIEKEVKEFAEKNWSHYIKSISECSKPSKDKAPLVESEIEVYCFDDICKKYFDENRLPASVDCVDFTEKEIYLVEFKSGFREKITKENYTPPFQASDEETLRALDLCKEYFFKNRDLENNELRNSLKLKAVESYMAFEKRILDACSEISSPRKLILYIVVDIDVNDIEEDVLGSLVSEKKGKNIAKGNPLEEIRQSLTRYMGVEDISKKGYFYDDVRVCSAVEFSKILSDSHVN